MKYQIDRFATDSYIDIEKYHDFSYPLHFHRALELIYVEKGRLTVLQPGRKTIVTTGESVLFLSNEIHGYESDSDTTYVCIVFSPSWISPFLKMIKGKQPVIPKFLMGELEVAYLKKIDKMSHQSIKMQGWLLLVCGTFLEQVDWEERSEENADLVTVIIDYIGRHYLEELTLRQLAKELGYDHFYLSHFIGKNIGTTFHQYLTSLRLAHSLDLLKTTDEKISTIAYQSGFPSTRTFNTHFKREFNQTPREYLQKQRKG